MKALVKMKHEYGATEIIDVPKPVPNDDQVLIKVKAAAVCGSDLHYYEYLSGSESFLAPVILGHEYAGVVEAVGSKVSLFKAGDRVMGESNQYCSVCRNCHEGRTNICLNSKMTGLAINGAMAEYIVVPEKIVHFVPEKVSFEEAALGQPCAVSFHGVFDQSDVKPGDNVVVFGPGIVGLMAAKAAQIMGASNVFIVGTDIDEAVRMPQAKSMGMIPLNGQRQNLSEEIEKVIGVKQVDVAIECSGASVAASSAISLVRKGGSFTSIGIYSKPTEIFLTQLVRNEIQLHTSYTCLWKNYEQALNLVASGQINLKALMDVYPFENALQAFQDAIDKKVTKPVLVFE